MSYSGIRRVTMRGDVGNAGKSERPAPILSPDETILQDNTTLERTKL